MKDKNCCICNNLTDEAKTSFLRFDLMKKDPCKLHKMPRYKHESVRYWKSYDYICKDFIPEDKKPIDKCKDCSFNQTTKCFLHIFPTIKWITKCSDYDKKGWEVKASKTNTYKKYDEDFSCRMSYDGKMPLSWKMMKGINCYLCEGRGGTESCPLTNGYLRKTIEIEITEELTYAPSR